MGGGGASEVLPLQSGAGQGRVGKASAMLKGGAKRFEVFLIWELEVLAILKGVTQVSTLKKGGVLKVLPCLEGRREKF